MILPIGKYLFTQCHDAQKGEIFTHIGLIRRFSGKKTVFI